MIMSMDVLENMFGSELSNNLTNYFIFDSDATKHNEVYFDYYTYTKEKYNLVKEGDLFLYRKPTKSSENGKFYFFGCGRVRAIEYKLIEPKNTRVIAKLDKCISFSRWIFQYELIDYEWKWKDKKNPKSFGQFFNNYGMNQIPKEDFLYIASLAVSEDEIDEDFNKIEIELTRNVQEGEYTVLDKFASVKTRGAAQKVFSNKLREIYNNKCCITGISTSSLLIGAHIIPWSKRQDTRLDPRNGLLLSVLMDRLFENGMITIDEKFIVHVSPLLMHDSTLYDLIKKYDGKSISLPPNAFTPAKAFLREKLNLVKSKTSVK